MRSVKGKNVVSSIEPVTAAAAKRAVAVNREPAQTRVSQKLNMGAVALIRVSDPRRQQFDLQRKIVEQYIADRGLVCVTVYEYRGSSYHTGYDKVIDQLALMCSGNSISNVATVGGNAININGAVRTNSSVGISNAVRTNSSVGISNTSIADTGNSGVGHLVVHSADRLSRSIMSFTQLLNSLDRNITIHLIEEQVTIQVAEFFPPTVKACEVYHAINVAQTTSAVLSAKMKSHHRYLTRYDKLLDNTKLQQLVLWLTNVKRYSHTIICNMLNSQHVFYPFTLISSSSSSSSSSLDDATGSEVIVVDSDNDDDIMMGGGGGGGYTQEYMLWTPHLLKRYLKGCKAAARNSNSNRDEVKPRWFKVKVVKDTNIHYDDILDVQTIYGKKLCKVSLSSLGRDELDLPTSCWIPAVHLLKQQVTVTV